MSQQCSWPTHSWPLEGRCPYYALLGLTQAPGFAGGHDWTVLFVAVTARGLDSGESMWYRMVVS